ncbi:WD40/YVTN/BNR-like repeat-containing protein [Tahibacter harae]|uniref:BNR/Asp-box repeat protein n=1 Tax=Tahibacter harae TaxID=2963937 RepID=A0ABT1QXV4_9GAMM|nr:sialidase family protein [Tahibacter harae]MCQ4167123.1 hypothetical protein [Tahibacter harae]
MMFSESERRYRRRRPAAAAFLLGGAALALLAGAGAARAAGNAWTRLDVPYGVDRVTVSPADPNRIMVRGGVFLLRSSDGGASWSRASQGLPPDTFPQDIAADPANPDRWITAVANRLWETRDNGASWQLLAEPPIVATYKLIRDLDWCGSSIYVGTTGGLFRSTNNGASFAPANSGVAANEPYVAAVGCRPDTPGLVFALYNQSTNLSAAPGTLYRSGDGGASWTPSVTGLASVMASGSSVRAIAFGPGGRMAAYLQATPRRLLVSQDNGLTFASGTTVPSTIQGGSGQLSWTSEATPRLIASGLGLNTTTDGVTWTSANAGLLLDTPNLPLGADGIQVAGNGAIWVANSRAGIFKSSDGIAALVEQPLFSGGARVNELVLHPTQPGQMLAVLMRLGAYSSSATGLSRMLVRSLDGGASWTQVSSQYPFGTQQSAELRIDPAAGSDITNATLYASDNPINPSTGAQFARSTDGGATWTRADTGIVATQGITNTRHLLLDPSSASAATRTLWLALDGRFTDNCASGTPGVVLSAARLWKSSNGADSWSSADGLPQPTCVPGRSYRGPAPRPVVLARASNGTLYAGTVLEVSYINSNDPVPGIANGVFRSTNGGTVWTHASNGLPHRTPGDGATSHRDVTAIAVMPGNDQIVFAAVSAIIGTPGQPGALYRSNDGGNSWTAVSTALQGEPRDLLIDPTNTARLYYQDYFYRRVYASEDGGATWGSLSAGLYAGSNATLTLDTLAPQPRLLLGGITGLFTVTRAADNDLDGVPSAMEAAAPNGGDGNFDAVADSQQAHVASVAPLAAPAAAAQGGQGAEAGRLAAPPDAQALRGADGGYLTVVVTPLSGTCAVLEDVARKSAQELAADRGAVRSDAIAFGLPDCTRARITVRGPALAPDAGRGDVVRIYGPTDSAIADSAVWGSAEDAQLHADGYSFSVEDGAVGDADTTAQRLRFVARLGSDRIFASGFQ